MKTPYVLATCSACVTDFPCTLIYSGDRKPERCFVQGGIAAQWEVKDHTEFVERPQEFYDNSHAGSFQ